MKILLTGIAGFIGYHLSDELMKNGHEVIGVDNMCDYYPVKLKQDRLELLNLVDMNHKVSGVKSTGTGSCFYHCDILDKKKLTEIVEQHKIETICHLAAQAGVRYSMENPQVYIDTNITGFLNILDIVRNFSIKHLIFASSSSVYGINSKIPFQEDDRVDSPASFYAVTKKTNEQMAYIYHSMFKIKVTGLRFFTVYGPWGRPDMAPMLFANALVKNQEIKVFNKGQMTRDFTYISDIVAGIRTIVENSRSVIKDCTLYNIGYGQPVHLNTFVSLLEKYLGRTGRKVYLDMQPGDVKDTWSDISKLVRDFGYRPVTAIEEGIAQFAEWFKDYYSHEINEFTSGAH
jgi:UDP-glucuronate 4-epimerase